MYLDVFDENPYGTNCWLLAADGSDEALVVDPGFLPERVHALLDVAGKSPAAVLLTHAHVDHAQAAGAFAGDVPVFVHPADAVAFEDPGAWGAGFEYELAPVKDLRTIGDGEVLAFAGFRVEVLHTPGHTPGHCIFRTDALVLSGDLVFAGSIGRSDFPNSSPRDMQLSLGRFLTLPDDLPVHPGHGSTTTVGRERGTNPFLVRLG
ncbi:MAG: MBL fold metallo-hydrolase [Actinobacteria bacterium]|nr:MBL fold metallo-hydrolase [Actinomycetota bacterium]